MGFYKSLTIMITLPKKPMWIRNFKYEWQSTEKTIIVGPISPKILKFDDQTFLMANRYIGTWVYNPEKPFELEWIIFGENVQPYFRYDSNHVRDWLEVGGELSEDIQLKLFKTEKPFELSFSKFPFKAVVIFTDHCDFDSDLLLLKQREFFKKHSIKTTKGFFLKKYSHKGDWNSAYEGNEVEFQKWRDDGHELANHSLSQSRLADPWENQQLFHSFNNPESIGSVKVWIDHGYQDYNLTKLNNLEHRSQHLNHLKTKGLEMFWNYFDVSEVCDTLNQLDYEQMTISRIIRAKGLRFTEKIRLAVFHLSSESNLLIYRKIATTIKKKKLQSTFITWFHFLRLILGVFKKQSLALKIKRTQSIFDTEIAGLDGFQTIIVKDWVHAFNTPFKKLQDEQGLAIIHSYFSFLEKHHINPLFFDKYGNIAKDVEKSFEQLSDAIKQKKIWNPTLTEFNLHFQEIKKLNLENLKECKFMRYV